MRPARYTSATVPLRSRKVFPVANYRDIYAANQAASDYAAHFTRGAYPSSQAPRLFVAYDKAANAYYVEPNPAYVPIRNEAWLALLEAERAERERAP